MSNASKTVEPRHTYVARTVVSKNGAVIKVTRLELSSDAKDMLRSKSAGINFGLQRSKEAEQTPAGAVPA
ncbi:MAG: hypothetical protein EKK45_24720 [Curvibacter sp.]|nr:MAG: hypothetical protein EKK45_24720 [Curvibacter sp.]